MLTLIDLRTPNRPDPARLDGILPRPPKATYEAVRDAVTEVIDAVATEGDTAIARFAEQFDGFFQIIFSN